MILEPKKIIPLLGIQHGMHVLDIGSGIGFWAKQLSPIIGSTGKIFAVDNHPDIIKRLYNDLQELGIDTIYPITADVHYPETIGVAHGICDKILVIRMIPSLLERLESIHELGIFLKQQGELIIIDTPEQIRQLLATAPRESVEIPLVSERTQGYYQGIRMSRSSLIS